MSAKSRDEDFQHLLPPAIRNRLLVVPIKCLQLSVASIAVLFTGIGLLLASFEPIARFALYGFPVALVMALVIGRFNRRLEDETLDELGAASRDHAGVTGT